MEKNWGTKAYFAVVGLIFLVAIANIGIGLQIVREEQSEIEAFFEQESVAKFDLKIPAYDGTMLSGWLLQPKETLNADEGTVPAILFIPGANALKTKLMENKFNLLRAGFAVIAMEQRGHGESEGFFSFYEKEPADVSAIIDYLETNYPVLNNSNIGLLGMSLGGGTAVHAQTLDDRIYASVIYHPLVNITDFSETIGVDFPAYLGYTPGVVLEQDIAGIPDWEFQVNESWYNRCAINRVTPENTERLLLLHGTADKEVRPQNSHDLINILDPNEERLDVQLQLLPGFGHGQTEKAEISQRYCLVWFLHYFQNNSISLADLDTEITYLNLETGFYPPTEGYRQPFGNSLWLTLIGAILLNAHYAVVKPYRKIRENDKYTRIQGENKLKENNLTAKPELQERELQIAQLSPLFTEKTKLIITGAIIIGTYLISGLYARFRNPSLIYGLIFYPSVALVLFCAIFLAINNGKEWLKYRILQKEQNFDLFRGIIVLLVFPLYFALINYGGRATYSSIYAPQLSVFLRFALLFTCLFTALVYFLREFSKRDAWVVYLFFLLGILVYLLINPVQMLPLLVGFVTPSTLNWALPGIVFAVLVIFSVIVRGYRKFLTNNTALVGLTLGFIISTLYMTRFFRII